MKKLKNIKKRGIRNRKKLKTVSNRYRVSIFRSLKNISAQIIDDKEKKTLVSVSSIEKELKSNKKKKSETSILLGEILANGEIVIGCVAILGDVPLYYHEIDVIGSSNIQVENTPTKPYTGTTEHLYHLLTNTGSIQRNKYVWKDYNNGLERFFE